MSEINLSEIVCNTCGIHFSIPTDLKDIRKENGQNFYCPNGHPLMFTNSVQSKLQIAERERDEWKNEATRLLSVNDSLREKIIELECNSIIKSPIVNQEIVVEKNKRPFYSFFHAEKS